ncbi:MlaA family lipoprotein [Paraburkholderia sediminicola]|uniref:MlaA family lipoprotein n=1 Tax=Paraburkholderia sediminicola TaxID=458836 RepID=UPI0038BD7F8B
MKSRDLNAVALAATVLLSSGCATGPGRTAGDPLEPMNRTIYSFNDKVDTYVAKPTAKAYQKVMPSPVQTAVRNFFSNLGDIGNFANDLLQLKATDASEDVVRFAFNSTLGIGGLIDWATPAGLPKHHQDFGLTLAHYGVPIGPYLVVPLFGPSSVRDVSNVAVDSFLNPFAAAPVAVRASVAGTRFVSARADLLSASNLLSQAAIDPYSLTRDLYLERRRMLSTKSSDADKLPDYADPSPQ